MRKVKAELLFRTSGKEVPVSSTKSFTGRLLALLVVSDCYHRSDSSSSFVPKTAGTKELSDYIEANVVYGEGQEADIQYAISNNLWFWRTIMLFLALKRWRLIHEYF